MLLLLLLFVAIITIIYLKLIAPFLYWKKRGIFHVNPWTRLKRVLLDKQPFPESYREAYEDFPDKKYYGSYQFSYPSLFVRDLALIKKITTTDFDHFADHKLLTDETNDRIFCHNLFSLKGQKWKEMRSTVSPVFSSSKMRAMFALLMEISHNFTNYYLEKYKDEVIVVEMKDAFCRYTNDIIASCAFGIETDSLRDPDNEFYSMGGYISKPPIWRSVLMGFFPKLFQILEISALPRYITEFFLRLVKDVIAMRERAGIVRPDVIHLLTEARRGRLQHDHQDPIGEDAGFATVQESEIGRRQSGSLQITDEVITGQALIFFVAGFTTTSSTMSFMAHELATHPDIQQRLQQEIDEVLDNGPLTFEAMARMRYLDQVVTETLRKWPPGYFLNRNCVKEYVVEPEREDEAPLVIEKNCLITISVIGVHYCPDFYPDPDRFDPDRFSDENRGKLVPGSYMPFGLGPRNCIGSRFALLEIKALMVTLLSKFDIVPVEKTVVPLQLAPGITMEVKGGAWLGLKRRSL